MSKKDLKEKPNLKGERYLLSSPTAELFEYGDYKYSVMPMNMMQKRKWKQLSIERYSLEKKWWNKVGIKSPYETASDVISNVDKDVLIKDLEESQQLEYLTSIENIDRGRTYAFEQMDLDEIFNIITQLVSVVGREDLKDDKINTDYLMYHCEWNEIVFLSQKIDDVSTLTPAEVLGLK